MKRFILMFIASSLLFLLFSYMDEYENLIAPYLMDRVNQYGDLFKGVVAEKSMEDFLHKYNRALTDAYLSSDPKKVSELPAGEEVKRGVLEEITFLHSRGNVMDTALLELQIIGITRLSPVASRINTLEKVRIRYVDAKRSTILRDTESVNEVEYTVMAGQDGLIVAAYEIKERAR